MLRLVRRSLVGLADPERGLLIPVLGFAVRFHPTFWLLAAVIVLQARASFVQSLLLVGIVAFSILTHELGHALAATRQGVVYHIRLHGLGGETTWRGIGPQSRAHDLLVTLAGPAAGLLLGTTAWLALWGLAPGANARAVLWPLAWVNFVWSAFNLAPIPPLDGGRALTLALEYWTESAATYACGVGLLCAGLGALVALGAGDAWAGVLLLVLAYRNYKAVQPWLSSRRRTEWRNTTSDYERRR